MALKTIKDQENGDKIFIKCDDPIGYGCLEESERCLTMDQALLMAERQGYRRRCSKWMCFRYSMIAVAFSDADILRKPKKTSKKTS